MTKLDFLNSNIELKFTGLDPQPFKYDDAKDIASRIIGDKDFGFGNDDTGSKGSKTPNGLQALSDSLRSYGELNSDLAFKQGATLGAYGKAIDDVNNPHVDTVDKVSAAVGDLDLVVGRNDLRTADGTSLDGVAGEFGIFLSRKNDGDGTKLRQVAIEELAERAYQSAIGNFSPGDFGSQVALRISGEFPSISAKEIEALALKDDRVKLPDGSVGEANTRTIEEDVEGYYNKGGKGSKTPISKFASDLNEETDSTIRYHIRGFARKDTYELSYARISDLIGEGDPVPNAHGAERLFELWKLVKGERMYVSAFDPAKDPPRGLSGFTDWYLSFPEAASRFSELINQNPKEVTEILGKTNIDTIQGNKRGYHFPENFLKLLDNEFSSKYHLQQIRLKEQNIDDYLEIQHGSINPPKDEDSDSILHASNPQEKDELR